MRGIGKDNKFGQWVLNKRFEPIRVHSTICQYKSAIGNGELYIIQYRSFYQFYYYLELQELRPHI